MVAFAVTLGNWHAAKTGLPRPEVAVAAALSLATGSTSGVAASVLVIGIDVGSHEPDEQDQTHRFCKNKLNQL